MESLHPLEDLHLEDQDAFGNLDYSLNEVRELTEALFSTLSTIEKLLRATIVSQRERPTTDEPDMIIIKSDSDARLSTLKPTPTKDLLTIDLQLIAAMQNSLMDLKFAKYLEHKNKNFDEQGRQMKYWASQLGSSDGPQDVATETQTALMCNLARIARTFGMLTPISCHTVKTSSGQCKTCPCFVHR